MDTALPVPFGGKVLRMGTDPRVSGTAARTVDEVQRQPGRPIPVAHNPYAVVTQDAINVLAQPTAEFENFIFAQKAIFDERPGYFHRIMRARFAEEAKFEAMFARYSRRMTDPREIIDMIWSMVFDTE